MAGGAGTRAVGPLGVCRAESFNYMMEGSEQAHRFRNLSALSGKEPPLAPCVIRVRNDTGADLDRYAVLGLDGPLIDPAIYEPDEFCRAVAFSGITPRAQDIGRWCLTNDPLEAGAIGRAVLLGVSICRLRVNTEGDQWAECYPTERVWLDSRSGGGSAEVLWCEAGTGYKWAIVRFPRFPASSAIEYHEAELLHDSGWAGENWQFGRVLSHPNSEEAQIGWRQSLGNSADIENLYLSQDFDDPCLRVLTSGLYAVANEWEIELSGVDDAEFTSEQTTTAGDPAHIHYYDKFSYSRLTIAQWSILKRPPAGDWTTVRTMRDALSLTEHFEGSQDFGIHSGGMQLVNLDAGDEILMILNQLDYAGPLCKVASQGHRLRCIFQRLAEKQTEIIY